nr:hypothetical protein [Tanacetum cinerariifolium]
KNNSRNGEVNTTDIPIASTQVPPAGSNVATASISLDTAYGYQLEYGSSDHEGWQILEEDREKDFYLRQGSKVEEQAPKGLMAIDGVGWDWSFMGNEEENHALVTDEEAPTEFSMMAKTSAESEVFDNSIFSKACKQNTNSLNSKITELSEKLGNTKNMLYHYKLGLSQDEDRLVECKNQEIKFCKKVRGLELKRSGKNKEGLGYNDVPPSYSSLLSSKKDMSSTRLPEFTNDTITDHSRPSPAIESTLHDLQNKNPSVTETEASDSTILSKPAIRKTSKKSNVGGTKESGQFKIPTIRKFPTGNTKFSTADLGNKGKAVKASACWI